MLINFVQTKKLSIMTTNPPSNTIETAKSLCKLYFTRAAFSVFWVILVACFAKTSMGTAGILLIIYPAWDVLCTIADIRINRGSSSKAPQYANTVISIITTIAVSFALHKGVPETLMVFGAWAIGTGLIQLVLGLRRRKLLGGQWPMIISGGQSMIGGTSFIILAHDPTKGISSLACYAAFGAFYYLLAAYRLYKQENRV
jgi:uncharacterized membrane protein HdeD (DUF308 family)